MKKQNTKFIAILFLMGWAMSGLIPVTKAADDTESDTKLLSTLKTEKHIAKMTIINNKSRSNAQKNVSTSARNQSLRSILGTQTKTVSTKKETSVKNKRKIMTKEMVQLEIEKGKAKAKAEKEAQKQGEKNH